jgi:hypothetical protein
MLRMRLPATCAVLQCLALPSTSFDVTRHRSRHSLIDARKWSFPSSQNLAMRNCIANTHLENCPRSETHELEWDNLHSLLGEVSSPNFPKKGALDAVVRPLLGCSDSRQIRHGQQFLMQCAKRSNATQMLAIGQTQTTALNAGLER